MSAELVSCDKGLWICAGSLPIMCALKVGDAGNDQLSVVMASWLRGPRRKVVSGIGAGAGLPLSPPPLPSPERGVKMSCCMMS